ncbi:MAG: tyrosine-type recombinase/integrase [bacterium]
MARSIGINSLTWDDVNLERKYVTLYTRKKRGGHLTPRNVPMTEKLCEILARRYSKRDKTKPWVFVNSYVDWKSGEKKEGPFKYRKTILRTLCKKVGVRDFRFHALRHTGASIMEKNNVPIGTIQRILGHEHRSTTEIYLHSIGEAEREAIRIYEQARKNSHTNSHTG